MGGDGEADQGVSLWPKGHPFTALDGLAIINLAIINNVGGYPFVSITGLMHLHLSHEPRGTDTEPQPIYGGQAHG
jgi:hypothetical protein